MELKGEHHTKHYEALGVEKMGVIVNKIVAN
jgi:hypothetical protein